MNCHGPVVAERVWEIVESETVGRSGIDLQAHLIQIRVPSRQLLGRDVDHGYDQLGAVLAQLDLSVELACHAIGTDRRERGGELVVT